MSLLKQILSPFVEFEKDPEKPVSPPPIQPPTAAPVPETMPLENAEHPLISTPASNAPLAKTSPAMPNNLSSALPEHQRYFDQLLDDANAKNPLFAGTDFKEFIDSKADIDNIADEETKYKTAFNVLKRTGLTKEKLISTAQEYHNIIGRDMNAFQGAHTLQYQKEVRQKEQLIQEKAEQLRALSEKMNALKQEISQLSQQMTETRDKMTLTKNSFLLAGENKQHEIQQELDKIMRYFG